MLMTLLIGVVSAALLLLAGYFLGAKQGFVAREQLRIQLLDQYENANAQTSFDSFFRQANTDETLSAIDAEIDALRDRRQNSLVSMEKIEPFMGVPEVKASISINQYRVELSELLTEIAESAGFKTVLLSDENGLPLAVSQNNVDLGRLAAISGFVVIFGDRIRKQDDFMPVALSFNDVKQNNILSRIFNIGSQRLVLTVVSNGQEVSLSALEHWIVDVIDLVTTAPANALS